MRPRQSLWPASCNAAVIIQEKAMVEERRLPRERELVLAPNEYAWVLDTTKGHINCYVGPNKTSLAQTDQTVVFDEREKRFVNAEIPQAIQLFATAPENWYLILKNPAVDGGHPRAGVSSGLAELQVGKKVMVKGPVSFALWPGQMARVVEAHRLQSNQYLIARVYDATLANKEPAAVLARDVGADEVIRFEVGQRVVIPGDRVAFYIPPNGVEVVPDDEGSLIRTAVTLQRLEYCVLASESGRKRTIRGEAVVFPAPDETFLEGGGRRRFRAIELSETTGIHVKVITPYIDENGVAHAEGDELFITGATTRLYFPREEHAVIRAPGGGDVHHAVAIPAGDGRYVLDRHSGEVQLVAGPRMLLPDPRHQVMTRRVLSDRECMLWYPGNTEALAFNRSLRGGPAVVPKTPSSTSKAAPTPEPTLHEGIDAFSRSFTKPTALLLDTAYDGAVTVEVWSGYAVCVKNRSGHRRIVVGPQSVMLSWDETLEALTLSTGTPKSTSMLLPTVFLRIAGNQVSDKVQLTSSDLVEASVHLTYRVGFEGPPERWFELDNYVKLLVEHAGSILKAHARRLSIRQLRGSIAEIARDAILGEKTADGRRGLAFAENGMRVFDVEVHGVEIADDKVRDLLDGAQRAAVASAVEVARREGELGDRHRLEEIARSILQGEQDTKLLQQRLAVELEEKVQEAERRRLEHRAQLLLEKHKAELAQAAADAELRGVRLQAREREMQVDLAELDRRQQLELVVLNAQTEARVRQAQALSPDLTAAITRLGDSQLLSSLASNFGELAAVEGKGLLETARKFLDFVPHGAMPTLRSGSRADAE
jgi:major vault protein